MTTTAQYASKPAIGSGTTTTADTSYTSPTAGTVGVISTATSAGMRVDFIDNICQGTSVAGQLRLWLCEGTSGAAVTSISFSSTTATVTTTTSHGLSSGNLITVQGAFPLDYNVENVAVSVTGLATFTYTMGTAPTINATGVGEYSTTPATATCYLLKEIPINPVTGSTTVNAWNQSLNSLNNQDFLPLQIPAGWSIRTTVSVSQTNPILTTTRGGQF
tara:strand:- start:215 stop:868 length:654 start_codon:yes stop_codon:yes gene_type:complete